MFVSQDRSALADSGTPTCITWMTVGALGPLVVSRLVSELDVDGMGTKVLIPEKGISLTKAREA